MKAIWKGIVIAKSDDVEEIDGVYYFPMDSVCKEYLLEGSTQNFCLYKGTISYFHIMIEGEIIENAAEHYSSLIKDSDVLEDRISFGQEIGIKESSKRIDWELLKALNVFF